MFEIMCRGFGFQRDVREVLKWISISLSLCVTWPSARERGGNSVSSSSCGVFLYAIVAESHKSAEREKEKKKHIFSLSRKAAVQKPGDSEGNTHTRYLACSSSRRIIYTVHPPKDAVLNLCTIDPLLFYIFIYVYNNFFLSLIYQVLTSLNLIAKVKFFLHVLQFIIMYWIRALRAKCTSERNQ